MKKSYRSSASFLAAMLAMAVSACGTSDGGGGGSSQPPSETGGVTAGGGSGTGGTNAGGTTATGGAPGTGGASGMGGAPGSGGTTAGGSSGQGGATTPASGGATGQGGSAGGQGGTEGGTAGGRTGGRTGAGGAAAGGNAGADAGTDGATDTSPEGGSGGRVTGTGGAGNGGATGRGGSAGGGTCTASKDAGRSVSGTGPHKVVIETNAGAGINCGTIYRPADLGGSEKYPIFVWGEGACSRNGLSNQAAMGEIASHGYFVVADGPPSGGNCPSIGMSTDVVSMAKPLIAYIDWAIAENEKSCSAYYQSLDTTKIAADGFSCGGLMAMGTAADPRMTAVGQTSSGLTSAVASYYKTVHTPFKILVGGSSDQANPNGARDFEQLKAAGVPTLFFASNNAGHGGDLNRGTGDFNTINLAWLNWQLKGDTGATGKALLIGSSCKYCTASGWVFKSANID